MFSNFVRRCLCAFSKSRPSVRRATTARRPALQQLDDRCTPANLTVSFSAITGTLTVVGDDASNNVTVLAFSGDATKFSITSPSDTINSGGPFFTSPTGVKNIAMRLLGGDDNVIFENTSGPIDVQGNLSISGGSGANSVLSTDLKVGKNITITNGTNITGIDANTFRNVTAGGALTISNGAGDTDNAISRLSAGNSFIKGNLRITNGTGRDDNTLSDLSVGGSVSINNGRAVVGGIAGTLEISNVHNTASLSVIRGNLTVVDLDGNVAVQTISDTEVLGNVTIFNGSGPAVTHFDGFATVMPVLVHGNVTIMGTGGNEVTAGTLYNDTGLVVGKNFTVITGSTADTLTFNKLQVGGVTKLALGGGANTVTVDNSQFSGAFILNTGAGIDTVSLDSTPASAGLTTFQRPVFMNLGAGSDSVLIGTVTDLTQGIVVLDTFVIRHGLGNDVLLPFGQAVFPFLTSLQWVV